MNRLVAFATIALLASAPVAGQWANRYPVVESFNHQVYLEAFDLPILNAGPMDPAPSPDGKQVAFSARGWIWSLEVQSGVAHRLTSSAGMDSRPSWSSDSRRIVFVRDSGRRLAIVSLDLDDRSERVLVDVDAIHLDPVFSPGGLAVIYASAEGGEFGLWRIDLETLERERLSGAGPDAVRYIERRPQILSPERLIMLRKEGSRDAIVHLDLQTGEHTTLVEDWITSQADFALAPDGLTIAYTWPADGHHELRLMSVAEPSASVLLTRSQGMPLAPAFGPGGSWIYFAEADDDERMQLRRIRAAGGEVETVTVRSWDWGTPTGTVIVRTTLDGRSVPTRMTARDVSGHPVIPANGAVRSELQWDHVFFYSDGTVELTAPVGEVTVSAVHGLETPTASGTVAVRAGATTTLTLELERPWDPSADGWYAGDNHFHLNYGGPYRLVPGDLVLDLEAEAMDVAVPLLANLHNRFLEQELLDWRRTELPLIEFGQEVRSHFLGHLMLLGVDEFFWPWVWGPGYQVYGADDRVNAEALRHARSLGGLGGYVHPVAIPDPFAEGAMDSIPIGFVADAVLGEVDLIEVACLWTDEIGTAALWHQVLNLGIPLAASAGSDVMTDYYRTMTIGATRVYVRPEGDLDLTSYLRALRAGRSFVTNGPLLAFTVDGRGPGEVVDAGRTTVSWSLDVASALPFDRVEIYVNGEVAHTVDVRTTAGRSNFQSTLEVPVGGWVTARVTGENTGWPALDSYLFAETSPVWFGAIGSLDPVSAARSAELLLEALAVAWANLVEGYDDAPIPRLLAHFDAARRKLEDLLASVGGGAAADR